MESAFRRLAMLQVYPKRIEPVMIISDAVRGTETNGTYVDRLTHAVASSNEKVIGLSMQMISPHVFSYRGFEVHD